MTATAHGCPPGADDLFGPIVNPHCRGGFDFTLLFEQSVLSMIPAAIIVVAFPLRLAYLATSRSKTQLGPIRLLKLVRSGDNEQLMGTMELTWIS